MKVLSVAMDKTQLAPGEEGLVAVETEAPSWTADEPLRLELVDKSGSRRLPLSQLGLGSHLTHRILPSSANPVA